MPAFSVQNPKQKLSNGQRDTLHLIHACSHSHKRYCVCAGPSCGDIQLLAFHPDLQLGAIATSEEEFSLLLQVSRERTGKCISGGVLILILQMFVTREKWEY